MKILKFFLKLILFILIIAIILVAALGFIGYDYNSSFDNQKLDSYDNVEKVLGDDLYNSLDSIKTANYDKDKNKITFDIKGDTNGGFYSINKLIASSLGVNDDGYVMDLGVLKIRNILVLPVDDTNIALKIEMKLFGFYSFYVKLIGKLEYDNTAMTIKFDTYKFGVLPLFKWMVQGAIDSALSSGNIGNDYFDIYKENDDFYLKMNYMSIINNTDNEILSMIFNKLSSSITLSENGMTISFDTKKIFKSKNNTTDLKTSELTSKYIAAYTTKEIRLTSDELTYLIKDKIDEKLQDINSTFKIGNKEFKITTQDTYVEILDKNNKKITNNFAINNTYAPISLSFDIAISSDKKTINFETTALQVGSTLLDIPESLARISVDADTLKNGYDAFKIQDISIDGFYLVLTVTY